LATTKDRGGKSDANRPKLRTSHKAGEKRVKRSAAAGGLVARTAEGARGRDRLKKARANAPGGPAGPSIASDEARELAVAIAAAALDKKASGLEILDVAGKVDYADFLVLMTGRSDRQVVALQQGIEDALRKKNRRPLSVEGVQGGSWILMDYGDVVVHVFQDDTRTLYDIDGLWLDARRVPIPVPEGMRGGAS